MNTGPYNTHIHTQNMRVHWIHTYTLCSNTQTCSYQPHAVKWVDNKLFGKNVVLLIKNTGRLSAYQVVTSAASRRRVCDTNFTKKPSASDRILVCDVCMCVYMFMFVCDTSNWEYKLTAIVNHRNVWIILNIMQLVSYIYSIYVLVGCGAVEVYNV